MLREFSLAIDEAHAEPLADALLEAGALSVVVEDAEAGTEAEQALFGEPGFEPQHSAWRSNRLVVLVDAGTDPAQLLAQARAAAMPDETAPEILALRTVQDADWVRLTQAQFTPVRISDRLWIVPSWHEPPREAQCVIRLDPGVAFGTGTHPTTRLCLQWLDEHELSACSVLDYGCGSGVLAIAAARLGARCVVGVDIDPQAVEAARLNSKTNLLEATPPCPVPAHYTAPEALALGQRFDVVVANILSNPLKMLAPALAARVAPAGALLLSGVLARQADEVIAAYRDAEPALKLQVWREDDGWVCIAGQRE